MPGKVYLDENGEPISAKAGKVYLDDNGEPIGAAPSTPPPGAATADMMAPSTMDGDPDTSHAGIGNPGIRQMMQGMDTRSGELRGETAEHPVRTAGTLALGALPAAGPLAAKIPGVIGGVMAKHPNAVSSIAGAVPGILSGDLKNAAFGAMLGNSMSRSVTSLGRRMRGPTPAVASKPPAMDMAKLGQAAPAPPRSAPQAPATPAKALEREVMAREPRAPINWREKDAVPDDAIKRDISQKGGYIYEAGESQAGLGERMAALLKVGTPEAMAEATQLAKALRQRGHIRTERAAAAERAARR